MINEGKTLDKIKKIHNNDEEQLEFIKSAKKRIMVTAPAGYGKTKSMISKIAYEISQNFKFSFKKILALTFSVNAATDIKEKTRQLLPELLEIDLEVSNYLDVSNYHNLAYSLLKKHGYYINESFGDYDKFEILSDDSNELKELLSKSDFEIMKEFDFAVKNFDTITIDNIKNIERIEDYYFDILNKELIPNGLITFNGLLVFSNKLLEKESVKNFYQHYYQMIIVDEFQDTNYLSYRFISKFINENKIIFIGDNIQKIYSFIGAISNLFDYVINKHEMKHFELKTNHRFSENEKMKVLDDYMRSIFMQYDEIDSFKKSAVINLRVYNNIKKETEFVVNHIISNNSNDSAILVRNGYSALPIIKKLNEKSITYFNGIFKNNDIEYKAFHKRALDIFLDESGINKSLAKRVLDRIIKRMPEILSESIYVEDTEYIFYSLLKLLKILFKRVKSEELSKQEKFNKIRFVLESNSLKHLMNEVEEKIVLTTMHGSKGLEWDYVYIPDVTAGSLPSYKGLCENCQKNNSRKFNKNICQFKFNNSMKDIFKSELSIFYVAITRAKKDVFLSSNVGYDKYGHNNRISCFAILPNLSRNKEF